MLKIDYLDMARQQGREDCLALRAVAKDMTGTEIIDKEHCVPDFDPNKDYSGYPVGAPVADENQVWTLLQPHDASVQQGRPSTLRALWGLCHTTDKNHAKPWVDPYGTSGMYMIDECYKDGDTVYKCLQDNVIHNAEALPEAWEKVEI